MFVFFFSYTTGLLNALQTDKMYKGKGYAQLVTKYLSKEIAKTGHNIYAGIYEENIASRSLFTKIGFKSVGECCWLGVAVKPAE